MNPKKKTVKRREPRRLVAYAQPERDQIELAKWIVGSTSKVRVSKRALAAAEDLLLAALRRKEMANVVVGYNYTSNQLGGLATGMTTMRGGPQDYCATTITSK